MSLLEDCLSSSQVLLWGRHILRVFKYLSAGLSLTFISFVSAKFLGFLLENMLGNPNGMGSVSKNSNRIW